MKHENQRIYEHPLTGRTVVETINTEPSLTQQQFKDECDINNIMKKYATTGQFTHVTGKQGMYGDFSSIKDYHTMVQTVLYAQEAFSTLPAEMRARFKNDPGMLLDFLQDSKNYDEALKLGLINKREDAKQNANELNKSETNATHAKKTEPIKNDSTVV